MFLKNFFLTLKSFSKELKQIPGSLGLGRGRWPAMPPPPGCVCSLVTRWPGTGGPRPGLCAHAVCWGGGASITHVPISAPPCVVASGAPSKRLDGTEHLFPGPARGWLPVCWAPEQKEGQAVGGHGACPSSGGRGQGRPRRRAGRSCAPLSGRCRPCLPVVTLSSPSPGGSS